MDDQGDLRSETLFVCTTLRYCNNCTEQLQCFNSNIYTKTLRPSAPLFLQAQHLQALHGRHAFGPRRSVSRQLPPVATTGLAFIRESWSWSHAHKGARVHSHACPPGRLLWHNPVTGQGVTNGLETKLPSPSPPLTNLSLRGAYGQFWRSSSTEAALEHISPGRRQDLDKSCKEVISDLLVDVREIMNRDHFRAHGNRNLCSTRRELRRRSGRPAWERKRAHSSSMHSELTKFLELYPTPVLPQEQCFSWDFFTRV